MAASISEIAFGRKTFFIAPDTSLIPDSFLEEYFALGFECYFINNDRKCSIQKKIEIILNTFKDVIIFFNIDSQITGVYWEKVITEITRKYNNKASVGVLYQKRTSREEREKIENKYLFDIGLGCGCIQLEFQKKQNFEVLAKTLYANQAQGRRKNIRAICSKSCTFSVMYKKDHDTGILQDISLSHFSFIYPIGKMECEIGERIADFHFNIRGFLFRSNAVLIMKRPVSDQILYIFAFTTDAGVPGMESRNRALLIPNVYQLMCSNCMTVLNNMFTDNSDSNSFENNSGNGDFTL